MLRALSIAAVVGLVGLPAAAGALAGCGKRADQPAADQPVPRRDAGALDAAGDGSVDLEQARFDEERRPDLIIAALGIQPGMRVADIGAGTGMLTKHLARAVMPGGKVVATDITPAVLDLLSSRMASAGLTAAVEPRLVEPEQPGLEPGAYDAILLAEVDNYFADSAAWLRAAKLALKPTGAIAITNRVHHRAAALVAAKAAGLHLVSESTPVPSTFIAVFHVEPPAAPPAPPPTKKP